jgi:TonB family protein
VEPVTAILLERDRGPRGSGLMTACSVGLHAAVAALVLFGPSRWLGGPAQAPKVVMTVSLGAASGAGPDAGGANPIGGRPVQRVVTQPPSRPEPARAPAAKTPEMTVPEPATKARPTKTAQAPFEPDVRQAPEEAKGRTPTTGPQEQFGSSFADTGARGLALGLATGGGGGTGAAIDVGNFCCPDYLRTMTRRITENWKSQQGIEGVTVMRFDIQRDGRLTNIAVEQSAGYVLDLTAQRALQLLGRLPPLPSAYTFPTLTVYLQFKYQR